MATKKTVSIRLELKDGETLEQGFQRIGTRGAAALAKIEHASEPASRQLRVLNATVSEGRAALEGFAYRAGPLGPALLALGPGGLAAAAGIGAATMGLVALNRHAEEAIQVLDELGSTADRLGTGVELLQELRYAGQVENIATNTVDMALQRFTRRVGEAAAGTGEALGAIREMGLQLRDTDGHIRPTADLLGDVAEALSQTEDHATRLRLAFKLFDSEGVAFLNVLDDGRDGLESIRAEAREFGQVISEDLVREAAELNNQLLAIRNEGANEFRSAMVGAAPVTLTFARISRDASAALNDLVNSFRALDDRPTILLERQIENMRNAADQFRDRTGRDHGYFLERIAQLEQELELRREIADVSNETIDAPPRILPPLLPPELEQNVAVLDQLRTRLEALQDPTAAWMSRLSDDVLPSTRMEIEALVRQIAAYSEAQREAAALDREAARIRDGLRTAEEAYQAAVERTADLVGHAGFTEAMRERHLEDLRVELGLAKDAEVELNQIKERSLELDARAEQLRQSLMTDQDRFNQQVGEYRELLDAGKISQDVFNDAVAQAEERLHGATLSAEKFGDVFAQQMWSAARSTDDLGQALLDVIAKMAEMVFYSQVFEPFVSSAGSSIGSFFGLPGGSTAPAGGGGAWWSVGVPSRRGNVFMGGEAVPFRRGGVVSQPTSFMMPSGRMGKMAEERPEAIMPLVRMGGDLGVKAMMSPAPEMKVEIHNYSGNDEVEQRRRTGPNGEQVLEVMIGQMVRRGRLDGPMKDRFGNSPQAAAR